MINVLMLYLFMVVHFCIGVIDVICNCNNLCSYAPVLIMLNYTVDLISYLYIVLS